jgi:hypothetical protein
MQDDRGNLRTDKAGSLMPDVGGHAGYTHHDRNLCAFPHTRRLDSRVALQPPLPSELCQLDYSTSEDIGSVVSARRKPARVKQSA